MYVKARKQHDCADCHRVIEPGQTYDRTCCTGDGTAFTRKLCMYCTRFAPGDSKTAFIDLDQIQALAESAFEHRFER